MGYFLLKIRCGPWGGPWTGSMDRVHGVVHGPGPSGGPWTPVHVLYTSRCKGYWENENGGEQYCFFYFFVNMSFWASVRYQEETSESLEGVSPGGVINHGKNLLKRFDSLYKLRGSSKFPGA